MQTSPLIAGLSGSAPASTTTVPRGTARSNSEADNFCPHPGGAASIADPHDHLSHPASVPAAAASVPATVLPVKPRTPITTGNTTTGTPCAWGEDPVGVAIVDVVAAPSVSGPECGSALGENARSPIQAGILWDGEPVVVGILRGDLSRADARFAVAYDRRRVLAHVTFDGRDMGVYSVHRRADGLYLENPFFAAYLTAGLPKLAALRVAAGASYAVTMVALPDGRPSFVVVPA
jgi:hypothetical protein